MDIKIVKNRLDKLSKREKIISFITLIAVLYAVFHMMLYSPTSQKAKIKMQTVKNLKSELEAINMMLSSQAAIQKEPEIEKLTLPEAEDLSGMLAAISREASMARVDFISISPEGIEYKDKFVELRIKIELRVKFRELYDFIKNIEARHKLFLVQDLKFETNSVLYPSGIAFLKAVTYLRKKP